jgi:hypothetical protein
VLSDREIMTESVLPTMCSYSDDDNTLSVMISLSDNTMCSYSDDGNTLSVMISLSDNTMCS